MATQLLIVDDEMEICSFLKDVFEMKNLAIDVAYSGEEALAKMEKHIPKACLLDVSMPGMNGLEVLKEIKQRFPSVKVFMVTGHDNRALIEEAMRLGAESYITKPLRISHLENDVYPKISEIL